MSYMEESGAGKLSYIMRALLMSGAGLEVSSLYVCCSGNDELITPLYGGTRLHNIRVDSVQGPDGDKPGVMRLYSHLNRSKEVEVAFSNAIARTDPSSAEVVLETMAIPSSHKGSHGGTGSSMHLEKALVVH